MLVREAVIGEAEPTVTGCALAEETVMSQDLVERLQNLSVSSPKPSSKRHQFNVLASDDEFSHVDPLKRSFRVVMNYKDMSLLGLKAGSLVELLHNGTTRGVRSPLN